MATKQTHSADPNAQDPSVDPSTRWLVRILGIGHIVVALILFYLLFKIWPPTPWPSDPAQTAITFFGRFQGLAFQINSSIEGRFILLVIVAGALGSFIHSATSFADYVGNRKFVKSWMWWYLLRPFIGVGLALTLYFVVRAGFVTGAPDQVNSYGIATLAALSGMFSKQATDKLEEVFATFFRPAPGKGDAKRGDKLTGPTVSGIEPREGPTSGGTEVTITGSGFVDTPSVKFGDVAAIVSFENATSIKATTPQHEPGDVEVVVTNPDGQQGAPIEKFTYLAAAGTNGTAATTTATASAAAAGAGADESDVEKLDGCGIDIVEDTPDEDLPITEGGVA